MVGKGVTLRVMQVWRRGRNSNVVRGLKGFVGFLLVVLSLVILRYFMLAEMSTIWILLIAVGVVSFVVGSRLLVDNVALLAP